MRELFGLSDEQAPADVHPAPDDASAGEAPDNVRPFSRRTRAGGSSSDADTSPRPGAPGWDEPRGVDRGAPARGGLARRARHGAIAADMESVWLAPGAGGRPFAVVRVIVDTPARELRNLPATGGAVRAAWVLRRAAGAVGGWTPG